jgi:hypothetical protein
MNYMRNYGTHASYTLGSLKSKRLKEKFFIEKISNFIETGTYMGDGVFWALLEDGKVFDKIVSIEYAQGLAEHAKMQFKKFSKVTIENGHSPEILSRLVPSLKTPTIFYLDAHEGGGAGVDWKKDEPCPLITETRVILEKFYDLNEAIIILDDERMLNGEVSGYPKVEILNEMYSAKGMVSCYLDDSAIFCNSKWLRS